MFLFFLFIYLFKHPINYFLSFYVTDRLPSFSAVKKIETAWSHERVCRVYYMMCCDILL